MVNSDAATNCQQRGIDLSNCLSSSAAGDVQTYCNNCANSLIRYFQDCAGGEGVDAVKRGIYFHCCSIIFISLYWEKSANIYLSRIT